MSKTGLPLVHPGQNWQDGVRMWNDSQLSLTQSETNYGKMYLRCGQRHNLWWCSTLINMGSRFDWSTDPFQTEQGITIHIGRDRCLFQVRVGPAVKKENRKRCDGCVRKKYSRKPREGNFRRYRQMQVRNFTIRPFKHWWKHRRFIPFLHMEMPKPVSSNDLIEPLNRNCIAISIHGCQYTQLCRHIAQTCHWIQSHLSQEY